MYKNRMIKPFKHHVICKLYITNYNVDNKSLRKHHTWIDSSVYNVASNNNFSVVVVTRVSLHYNGHGQFAGRQKISSKVFFKEYFFTLFSNLEKLKQMMRFSSTLVLSDKSYLSKTII